MAMDCTERKKRLKQTFMEMESKRELLARCTAQWKEIEDYFAELEESARAKMADLQEKEKALHAESARIKDRLESQEKALAAREEASLARIQERRDAAVAAIAAEKSRWLKEKESAPPETEVEAAAAANGNEAKPLTQAEVRVRPRLMSLCKNMEGENLRKYMVDHRKDAGAMRNELPSALEKAIDPVCLVLKALEGYDLEEPDAKDSKVAANRRACVLLLECLAQVLSDPSGRPAVPSNVKSLAREIANGWRSKWESPEEALGDHSLDAQAFLQLLATFGIASDYNQDELCNLVTVVARRNKRQPFAGPWDWQARFQVYILCVDVRAYFQKLWTSFPKTGREIVDKLSKDGKQMEALSLAHAFGTMDKLQPIALLKLYAEEVIKTSQESMKSASNSVAAQNEVNGRELVALKAVWTAVEEYGLEKESLDYVQKRIAFLEKSKADRKRAATTVKAQPKRPRASGSHMNKPVTPLDKGYYRQQVKIGGGVSSYVLPTQAQPQPQALYDRRLQAAYNPAFAVNSLSPPSLTTSSYFYSPESLGSTMYAPSTGYTNLASYTNYRFGAGYVPPQSTYQGPLM